MYVYIEREREREREREGKEELKPLEGKQILLMLSKIQQVSIVSHATHG